MSRDFDDLSCKGSTDDVALLPGSVRLTLAKGRMRKRGPRSSLSILRRACQFRRAPPGATSGQTDVDASGISPDLAEASSASINSHTMPQTVNALLISVHINSNISPQSGNIFIV